MGKRERGAFLAHTDRFLKAKRNVLFWAVSLLALELVHTGEPLKPTALGTEVLIPPKLLAIGITLTLIYHIYGFWIERRAVVWQNGDLPGDPTGSLAERLERQEQLIRGLASTFTISGLESQIALSALQTNIEDARAAHLHLQQEWKTYVASLVADHQRLTLAGIRFDQADPSTHSGPIAYEIVGSAVQPHDTLQGFLEDLGNHLPPLERSAESSEQLSAALRDTYARLNRVGSHVDVSERRTFRLYDTAFTLLIAALALLATGMDLVANQSLGTMLPESLRTVAASKSENATGHIPDQQTTRANEQPSNGAAGASGR
jgi:hypothetical protein